MLITSNCNDIGITYKTVAHGKNMIDQIFCLPLQTFSKIYLGVCQRI